MTILMVMVLETLFFLVPLTTQSVGAGIMVIIFILLLVGVTGACIYDCTQRRFLFLMLYSIAVAWYLSRLPNYLAALDLLHDPDLGFVWLLLGLMAVCVAPWRVANHPVGQVDGWSHKEKIVMRDLRKWLFVCIGVVAVLAFVAVAITWIDADKPAPAAATETGSLANPAVSEIAPSGYRLADIYASLNGVAATPTWTLVTASGIAPAACKTAVPVGAQDLGSNAT